ncbi:MAG: glucosyl-3-phosphoglycerate synthase, partial [Luteolibacter sp.]
HVARGDIICYLDADVVNFHCGFLSGLLGPLLKNPSLSYVKAYYQRPLMEQDIILPDSGGRVSEILVRPLISMFYPELVDVIQPLAGEYAARRELLEQLAYPVGYGVEIAHLIDLAAMGKLDHFGQTDLSCRVHRNRDDGELGDAAYTILQVILRRLQRDGKINLNGCHGNTHHRWLMGTDGLRKISKSLPEPERPPIQSWLMQHDKSLCVKAAVEDARSHL